MVGGVADLLITQYRTNQSETIRLDLGQKRQCRAIKSGMKATNTTLPYESRTTLLSEGERRFYFHGLKPAIERRYLVSFKVRLADVITVKRWRSAYGRKIAQKHLDFVLLTPAGTRIVAAIELNDATHQQSDRQIRDEFVRSALHAARVPLVTFPVYRKYDPKRIDRRIRSAISRSQRRSDFA